VIGQQAGANWTYFGYDGLGSVRQVTNSAGTIGYSANYDPYGNPLEQFGTLPTNLGFTGEYNDPSGLLYLRARYANPSIGTFLTRDPFDGYMMRAMSRNGYSYVEGNPVNYADPSGKFLPGIVAGLIVLAEVAVVVTAAAATFYATYWALDVVRCANHPTEPSCTDGTDPIKDLMDVCAELLNPPQTQTTDSYPIGKFGIRPYSKADVDADEAEAEKARTLGVALGLSLDESGRRILEIFANALSNDERQVVSFEDWSTVNLTRYSGRELIAMNAIAFGIVVTPIISQFAEQGELYVNLEGVLNVFGTDVYDYIEEFALVFHHKCR